ncbi:cyclodeaminase [Oceanobacillus longus]|uniref:Cyclodeaminase n=1 Tax=Oceanobacillus longus TaxID=930120 RepID=A0ABV8GXR7_9BACI
MKIFDERQIRKFVHVNPKAIEIVEEGFTALARGNVTLPPIMSMDIPEHHGEIDVKTAYIKGLDTFAVKISSGFFNNQSLGLPSLSGMMLLLCSKTGLAEAILLDNGYLTDIRTAAAGAVAADYLAKEQVKSVGVIGTGTQARYQMEALLQVRDFDVIYVYGRKRESAEKYAAEIREKLEKNVIIAESVEEVIRMSEIVVTTTSATEPFIKEEWLHPGLHITAMGSDTEHKQELDAKVFQKADVIVCDVQSQCFRLGELHHAIAQGIVTPMDPRLIELGELTSGMKKCRRNDKQITICDLTGTGVQDTVIARFAYAQLQETTNL